jgi:hypothetical protein
MEKLASYVRQNEPLGGEPKLVYNRMVRLMLDWMDSHRPRDLKVFLAQEGKEYPLLLRHLEDKLGLSEVILDRDLFLLAWDARIPL